MGDVSNRQRGTSRCAKFSAACYTSSLLLLLVTLTGGCREASSGRAATSGPPSAGEPLQVSGASAAKVPTADSGDEGTASDLTSEVLAMHRILSVRALERGDVQQELKLTPEAVNSVAELGSEARGLLHSVILLDASERRTTFRDEVVPAAKVIQKRLGELLDADQQRKLSRFVLQEQKGPGVFLVPWVADELKITAEQRTGIVALLEEMQSSASDAGWNPIKLYQLSQQATEYRELAKKLLDESQQARWESLLSSSED